MLGHEAISRFMPHFEVHASVRDPELAAQYELPGNASCVRRVTSRRR